MPTCYVAEHAAVQLVAAAPPVLVSSGLTSTCALSLHLQRSLLPVNTFKWSHFGNVHHPLPDDLLLAVVCTPSVSVLS